MVMNHMREEEHRETMARETAEMKEEEDRLRVITDRADVVTKAGDQKTEAVMKEMKEEDSREEARATSGADRKMRIIMTRGAATEGRAVIAN